MRTLVYFFICLLGWNLSTSAQAGDDASVAAAVETLNRALVTPNLEILQSITADELSYGHSSGQVQTRAEFIADLMSGPFDILAISISNQSITLAGNNAIVRHTVDLQFSDKGVSGNLKVGNLLVWQKQGGMWKLLARQAFKL